MRTQYIVLLMIAGLTAAVSCGNNNQAQDRKGKGAEGAPKAVPVEVSTPSRADMEGRLNLTATAYSEDRVPVYSETTGIVEGKPLEEGTSVARGAVLARLKRQELELSMKLAQSTLNKARADFERSKELFQDHLISRDTYDQSLYAYDQAKLSETQAKVELEKATITAPIAGVVAERMIRRGDLVKPQQQLFTLVNLSTIKASLYVPEKNIREVKVDSPVRVRSDAFPERSFSGRVERIAPVADPNTGTFKVTVALENPQRVLKPGMFLATSVVLTTHAKALVVPKKCLVFDGDKPYVFLVRKNEARKIPVVTGLTDLTRVEIVKGVSPSDRVVTVGQSGLKEGASVTVLSGGGGSADLALGG